MLGLHPVRPYPKTHFAFGDSERAVSAQHTPGQNPVLAALPVEDYERLLPDLDCECYAVVKREYDRLLPNAGKPKSRLSATPLRGSIGSPSEEML